MRDDSHCKKRVLCGFEVILSNAEAQVEVCQFCGKKVVYHKEPGTGRIDNAKYLRDHIRDTVQPFGRTRRLFLEIYGESPTREFADSLRGRKSKAELAAEWEQKRQDLVRRFKKNSIYR